MVGGTAVLSIPASGANKSGRGKNKTLSQLSPLPLKKSGGEINHFTAPISRRLMTFFVVALVKRGIE
jgi:hypothetical protein